MRKKTLHTFDSLLARTEEVGNCLEWQGYFQNGTPYVQHGDKFMAVRALVMQLLGNTYQERMFFGINCDNKACINPEHIAARSIKNHAKYMAKKTNHTGIVRLAKLQRAAEKRRILTDDQVMQIFADERTCKSIAQELGVSSSLVAKIKRGKSSSMVVAKNNPFWGLMA